MHSLKKQQAELQLTASIGALKGTRTPDPLLRRQMLYPAELSAQVVFFTTKIIITHVALIIKVFLPCFNFFCV